MTRKPIRRGTGRVGLHKDPRIRRLFQAQAESKYVLGDTVEAGRDGRQEVRIAPLGGLMRDRDGLMVDPDALGEKNLPRMAPITKLDLTATLATNELQAVADKVDEILDELVRTRRQRKP